MPIEVIFRWMASLPNPAASRKCIQDALSIDAERQDSTVDKREDVHNATITLAYTT